MMGGFQFIKAIETREGRPRRSGRLAASALAATLLGAALLAAAPAAEAEETSKRAEQPATAHARVSTSPDERAPTAGPPQASPNAGETADATPLTRAAARRRVDSISPVPWLARFGPVSLERRE